jgi:hypothetical protein
MSGTKLEALGGVGTNGFGLGAGVRVIGTTSSGFAASGTLMYHATKVDEVHMFYATSELGYELRAGDLKVMPYVGAGLLVIDVDGEIVKSPMIVPGMSAHYEIPKSALVVGVDFRVHYVTEADDTALGFYGSLGGHF